MFTMRVETEADGTRVVAGSNTYVDGSVYYGPEEFEAEHGMTFDEFCRRQDDSDNENEFVKRSNG